MRDHVKTGSLSFHTGELANQSEPADTYSESKTCELQMVPV